MLNVFGLTGLKSLPYFFFKTSIVKIYDTLGMHSGPNNSLWSFQIYETLENLYWETNNA